jgi:hypothetical protein
MASAPAPIMNARSPYRTPYEDVSGQPKLRESIVAFFDILGFSDASTGSSLEVDSQEVLNKIVSAIEDSRNFVQSSFPNSPLAQPGHWAVKFFSDNLAFGYPFDDAVADLASTAWFVVRCAQRYQLKMTLNGYFLRGALTQGPICLTDEIIFGSALVECYRLESKASIVPRVIMTEPLRQLLLTAATTHAENQPMPRDSVCRDVDGWWFLNYLDTAREGSNIKWEFVEQHKESILKCLSATTRHEVLPKYGWACRYHNVFCHWHSAAPGYSDKYRIARADENSTIYRLPGV